MYKKITSLDQLKQLTKNKKVFKFPIKGEPVASFNKFDENNSSTLEVEENRKDLEEIKFAVSGGMIGTIGVTTVPAIKTYTDILDSGKYWTE